MNTASIAMGNLKAVEAQTWHLTEEQIDEELMGALSGEAAAHLAECVPCTQRVAEASMPMARFRDVTMAWSERRSATMPIPSVQAGVLVWQRRVGWAMTACALVVGISLTGNERKAEMLRASVQSAQGVDVASMRTSRVAAVPVVVASGAGDASTADRYSGDNRMLKAIDRELDASVESPAAMGLETVSDQPHSQSGTSSLDD
jgi:hypothetical protein